MKIRPEVDGQKDLYENLGYTICSRKDFIHALEAASQTDAGFSASRFGISEQFWMYYPVLLENETNQTKIRVYEKHLRYNGFFQAGIFPADPAFYLEYNSFYMRCVREIDWLGLLLDPVMGPEILRRYKLTNRFLYFKDLIPDRSTPCNPGNDYLHLFKGKRLIIVCPFAELLKQRATRDVFEGVWSKIGKKWFYPESVEAVQFPYGFQKDTFRKYRDAIALFEDIASDIASKNFDVALIAAAGLTVPIAAHIKQLGKIAVSLGGDLQVLFGVIGKRWRNKERWKRDYFNKWWINMPPQFRPEETEACEGAYW